MKNPPLPLPVKHWRSRWLVLPSWRVLHRISQAKWDRDDKWIHATGTSCCGLTGRFMMPGFISRLGLPRCKHCCRIAGVPAGDGAPFNDHLKERDE